MSDKISYVLEVLDGYSKVTAKLKEELSEIKELTKFKFNSSDFKGLAQLSKEYDKIAKSAERIKKAKTGFTLVGGGFQSAAISSGTLRANMAYRRSLENALVPYSNKFIRYGGSSSIAPNAAALRDKMRQLKENRAYKQSYVNGLVVASPRNFMMSGGSTSGIYNPKSYNPNFSIPIDSTYRRDAAGTGIVPYSRGGAVMSYGQRPMIDVTGTARTINQESTASWQSEQRYYPKEKGTRFSNNNDSSGSDSSGSDRGVTLKNVAKSMGYYRAIDMVASAPSKIHDVTIQMESLTNTFDALIPKTKGYEGETAESQIKYLREISDKLGIKFSDIADPYRKMMATGVADKQLAQQLTESVGGYSRLVGMDSGAFKGTMLAFEQMLTKQKIQAQEFNLQTQQMPGVKPIFYEAFRRIMEKKGVKLSEREVTPTFLKYMEAGALDSVALLREFSKVVKEDFWVDVMKKAQSTQAQENRLSNAFYNLAADIGKSLNPTINKTVIGLTETIEGVSQFGLDLQTVFEAPVLKQFKDFFLKPLLEGLKLLPSAIMDLIKYIGQGAVFAIKGFVTGNFEELNKLENDLSKKWFGIDPEKSNTLNNQFTPIPTSPQEVIVKIVGENLPTGISIKQESQSYGMTPRPRTVIAGGL
jgi:tape measure domain-containing protein